jgi:prepilin-type N-terminal cleavage/methylation domain-containing protein
MTAREIRPGTRRRGFTVTEMLVAIALIVVLLGLLLPALSGVWSGGQMTKSMSNMRQIALWMGQYSSDNQDFVLPARFNYVEDPYPGKVRSYPDPATGVSHSGTWCDILWSVFEVGVFPEASSSGGNDYRHEAPDRALYELLGESAIANPFRSTAPNTRNTDERMPDSPEPPKPYGKGANEAGGGPGYFAANNFFDGGWVTDPDLGEFFTNGQIRFPDRSMYLVDSYAGEIIQPVDSAGDGEQPYSGTADHNGDGHPDVEVDFRYGPDGVCLMLFLDGHVTTQSPWEELADLEGPGGRGLRIRDLTSRTAPAP